MSVASVESEWDMVSIVVENAENTVASFLQEDRDGGGSSHLQDLGNKVDWESAADH